MGNGNLWRVTYSYNLGGLLEKVRGEKSYGYDYITKLGYDKFEQRSYLKYCNGAETFYTYDNRRRLSNLAVNSGGTSIMDNAYTFDAVSNVLSVANNASLPQSGNAGGQMSHSYTYDGLYRLASATGTYTGADNKSASYTLAMGYDNMHRITSKRQHLTQDNVQFNGTLNVGYDLTYTYGSEEGKKFQLESVKDVNYRTEETPGDNNVENGHVYSYDKNGNLVYVNTSRMMTYGHKDNSVGERKLIWDEENRLLAVDDNGFVSNYWYDADGERTVKTSGESDQVYVNGVFSGGSTNTAKFSLYVSPYLVANQGGRYTKHIYAGSQRIVSKVGDFASYGSDPRRIEYAGSETDGLSVDYKSKYTAQQQVIKDHYQFFDVPYNGTDNNNYADGEGFCCNDGTLEAAQAKAMRKAQSRAVAKSFKDPDNYENLQFFYHPDHLGSSSFITNLDGEIVQHIEYVPFGEVFIEERNSVWNTPYLFNAKEFDEETGMYYYGARYYEPRLSLWMSTDPMTLCFPSQSSYTYCSNNPVIRVDPDGMADYYSNMNGKYLGTDGNVETSTVYRLIDPDEFTKNSENVSGLEAASQIITINNEKIQSDIQSVRDLSLEHGLENQMYIYLDKYTAEISSFIGEEGGNSNTALEYYPASIAGVNYAPTNDSPKSKIIIGQLHGHPDSENPNMTTLAEMSDFDKQTAMNMQIPIYGVDAMKRTGKTGASVNFHRVDPNGKKHTKVGKTIGNPNNPKAKTINIGKQALEIWGKSGRPKFD